MAPAVSEDTCTAAARSGRRTWHEKSSHSMPVY